MICAELAWPAAIAALLHHREQAAGGQRRELRQVSWMNGRYGSIFEGRGGLRGAAGRPGPTPGRPCHGARATAWQSFRPASVPRGNSAGSAPRDQGEWSRRRPLRSVPGAAARCRKPRRTNCGQRRPQQWQCHRGRLAPSFDNCAVAPLPGPRAAQPSIDPVRNPDASRYFCAPGGGVLAPHDWCGRDGCSGNGDRLRVASVGAPSRRSLRRNKYGRDRNGCRSAPGPGSPGTRTAAPAFHRLGRGNPRPPARPQADAVDAIPPGCDDAPAFVLRHGVGHGADANCHVGIGAVPALRYRHGVIATADRLSGTARPRTDQNSKQNSGNWDSGTVRGAARSASPSRQSK